MRSHPVTPTVASDALSAVAGASRRPARRRAGVAVAATAAGALAPAALAVANNRRWSRSPDPTEGGPLGLPLGAERVVAATDGAQLWVTEMGTDDPDAPLVVFSHCWTGDHRVWAPVARRLLADHRVVLYDQRGHGRSTVGSAGLTLQSLADDLRTVLEAVDATDAVVAGHSMGGMTAQLLAVHHPDVVADRVAHLVLVATACDRLGYGAALRRLLAGVVRSGAVGRVIVSPVFGPTTMRGVFGSRPHVEAMRATVHTFVNTPRDVRADMLLALAGLDLGADLGSVTVPASIIVGSADTLTPVARSRRMHDLLSNSTLEVLKGKGHMLPFEAPDLVADRIREAAAARPATVATASA